MAFITRLVGALVTSSNPVGAKNTSALGHLDDAASLTLVMTTSATALTSSGSNVIKVSMFDPADAASTSFTTFSTVGQVFGGENFSTAFYTMSSNNAPSTQLSSGNAYTISNVSFRGITLNIGLSSGNTDGEIVAWVMKEISV